MRLILKLSIDKLALRRALWCLVIAILGAMQVFEAQAQKMPSADSLKRELENAVSEEAKLALELKLSFAYSGKDPDKSRLYARRVIADSSDCTSNQLTDVYRYLGYAYLDMNQYDSALTGFTQALRFSGEIDNLPIWISTARLISSCHRNMGNVTAAFKIAFKALHLADSLQDHVQMGHLNNQIGELYRVQVETEEAVNHLEKSYADFKAANIPGGMLGAKANLALAYKQTDPEKAFVVYQELLREFSHMFGAWDSARVYSNLANICLDLNRYEETEQFLMKALECHGRIDQPVSLGYCYKELGELYSRTEQPLDAVKYGHLALDIANEYGHHAIQHQVSKQLADAYAKLGEYKRAHEYLQDFMVFQDSVRSKEKIQLSNELEEKYASEKKERQIKLQEEQLARQKAEIKEEQILRNALLIGFVLLLIIGAIVYHNYRLQNRKNAEIRQSALRIQTLQATQSRWFTNIAHELRTPLTLILGPIQNLLQRPETPESTKSEIGLAKKYGDQLVNRVNEILEISRLESGKLVLYQRPADMVTCLKRVMASFGSYASEKGVDLQFHTQVSHAVLNIDASKITTIVNNLVANAIKFTPSGKSVRVEFLFNPNGDDAVRIKVVDSGIGISKDDIPHVFERFYQASGIAHSAYGGSGVGLTLSQELAKLHGGGISVSSEMGKGSTFLLSLPRTLLCDEDIELEDDLPIGEEEKFENDVPRPLLGSKPKILLVEDHSDMRKYITGLLKPYYEIKEATDGERGLEVLQDFETDLIISDVKMPGMDGLTFAKRVKSEEKYRLIPFINLTAHANEKDKLTALKTGVDDYLTKPFDAEELLVRVHNLISNAQERKKALQDIENGDERGLQKDLSHDEQLLGTLENLVQENISDSSFSVAELAEQAAMSDSSLSRHLKKMTGLTPGRFIRDIRLQRAIQLLESKQYATIAEVVYAVGFEDVSSFSRLFKKRFGKSPSNYTKPDG